MTDNFDDMMEYVEGYKPMEIRFFVFRNSHVFENLFKIGALNVT